MRGLHGAVGIGRLGTIVSPLIGTDPKTRLRINLSGSRDGPMRVEIALNCSFGVIDILEVLLAVVIELDVLNETDQRETRHADAFGEVSVGVERIAIEHNVVERIVMTVSKKVSLSTLTVVSESAFWTPWITPPRTISA